MTYLKEQFSSRTITCHLQRFSLLFKCLFGVSRFIAPTKIKQNSPVLWLRYCRHGVKTLSFQSIYQSIDKSIYTTKIYLDIDFEKNI